MQTQLGTNSVMDRWLTGACPHVGAQLDVVTGGTTETEVFRDSGGEDGIREARCIANSKEMPAMSALGALTNPGGEFFDVIKDFTALGHFVADLFLRVHDRGVVAAERLTDLR